VLVIENTSQVVSMDSDGNIKVWDIKKFNCVQAFSVDMSDEKHRFNPQSITYIPKPIKLVAAGTKKK
jgi:WD40 repeat protein